MAKVFEHYKSDLLFAKDDASVYHGFELVTHPMTFEAFNEIDWSHVFNTGDVMTSADVERLHSKHTGMHDHLSKRHFTTFHMYKIMNFLYQNKKFVESIGERKSNRYCSNFPNYEEVKKSAKRKRTQGRGFINMTSNERTIELRFFAGCHTEDMFRKNIEFVQSLFDFTRDASKENSCNVTKFKDYVYQNEKLLPNLADFLCTLD